VVVFRSGTLVASSTSPLRAKRSTVEPRAVTKESKKRSSERLPGPAFA
jgi:hypothetical protein